VAHRKYLPKVGGARNGIFPFARQMTVTVSKTSQRTFGLSIGALFASNDSKTSFELRKNGR
jgi:hypothetical protein